MLGRRREDHRKVVAHEAPLCTNRSDIVDTTVSVDRMILNLYITVY